jgi:hypothetical protein
MQRSPFPSATAEHFTDLLQLMIEASLIPAWQLVHYQTIHEYERYMPLLGWGNTNHLLPTDPGRSCPHRTRTGGGEEKLLNLTLIPPLLLSTVPVLVSDRYSNHNRTQYFGSRDEAVQELEEGWEEVEHWSTSAGVVVSLTVPLSIFLLILSSLLPHTQATAGWLYAFDMYSVNWYPKPGRTCESFPLLSSLLISFPPRASVSSGPQVVFAEELGQELSNQNWKSLELQFHHCLLSHPPLPAPP